jgi:hypothetical protein
MKICLKGPLKILESGGARTDIAKTALLTYRQCKTSPTDLTGIAKHADLLALQKKHEIRQTISIELGNIHNTQSTCLVYGHFRTSLAGQQPHSENLAALFLNIANSANQNLLF